MNKKEALAILGVSERTLTNYVKSGRLDVRYEKGATGKVAVYNAEQVRALRQEINDPATPANGARVARPVGIVSPARVAMPVETATPARVATARQESLVNMAATENVATLARVESHLPEGVGQMAELAVLVGNHIAESINDSLNRQQLSTQPLLTFPEAAAYSRVPERMLRDAVKDGALQARKIGRGSKVRRVDVDTWIEKLYHA